VLLAAVDDAVPSVAAAALNALFDVFAEADKNAALAAAGAGPRLQAAHARLRSALPMLRRDLARDEAAHVSEAVLNLRRFLVYKAKEGIH
jgi:hypothetical protein